MTVNRLKDAGTSIAGVLLLIAFIAVPILFLFGAAEFSVWALDWIPGVIGTAILACLVLVPLALVPATRWLAGVLFGITSFVFAASLWLYCLAFTYIEWGMLAVVIGVLLAGVGVIFTGILAALFSGGWVVLGNIAILAGLYFGTTFLASWLGNSAERRALRKMAEERPSDVVITRPSQD